MVQIYKINKLISIVYIPRHAHTPYYSTFKIFPIEKLYTFPTFRDQYNLEIIKNKGFMKEMFLFIWGVGGVLLFLKNYQTEKGIFC